MAFSKLNGPRISRGTGAFTLLELLVVTAIIGILATLSMSGLGAAKQQAHGITCMNNQKQLTLGWLLYIDDHEDWLPYNYGAADTRATVAAGTYKNWVNNVMTWETEPENTNTVLTLTGGIGPYMSGVPQVYRCPSDRVVSDVQAQAGWYHRVRSMSMNAALGYAGGFSQGGTNINIPHYKQFFKASEIPDPSNIFVFIEEHPDSINDGYFLDRPGTPEWVDLPASYHRRGANISFADGHNEFKRWQSSGTLHPARPDGAPLPFAIPADDRADFNWLMRRMSVYYNPK
jgi:prepilin-type N-terminal cleavage/methylation domain-containing protein/prepilin-type processing-associated H-X9-DG protein